MLWSVCPTISRHHIAGRGVTNAPVLGSEYDYVVGSLLIRVSGVLTPTQAGAYKAAATK